MQFYKIVFTLILYTKLTINFCLCLYERFCFTLLLPYFTEGQFILENEKQFQNNNANYSGSTRWLGEQVCLLVIQRRLIDHLRHLWVEMSDQSEHNTDRLAQSCSVSHCFTYIMRLLFQLLPLVSGHWKEDNPSAAAGCATRCSDHRLLIINQSC